MGVSNPIVRPVVRPVVGSVSNPYGIGPPFNSDLDQWLKGIDDNVFNEIKVPGANGAILPRVGYFNETDDRAIGTTLAINPATDDFSICTKIKANNLIGIKLITSNGSQTGNAFGIVMSNAVVSFQRTLSGVLKATSGDLPDTNLHTLICTYTQSTDTLELYIDNVLQVGTTANSNMGNVDVLKVGAHNNGARPYGGEINNVFIYNRVITAQERADCVNGIEPVNPLFATYLKGNGGYDYDISGNTNHLTWAGTGTQFTYDSNGSLYHAQNGYALWQKAGSDDIQVNFDLNGDALVLVPGTNIPTGYTEIRDLNGDVIRWNVADALFGMNETGSADAVYAIWDRQNATRQTQFSRDSIYYDATSLATRSRYHVSEITDPLIYSQLFEVGYKGRVFAKVVVGLDGVINVILLYIEELNYGTDKTGVDEYKVMKYCGIEDYALLGDGNQPIYDDNDYVIIV